MKKNNLTEKKKMDVGSLKSEAEKVREEIAGLTMDKNTAKLTNLKAVKNKRRDLAQILTVVKQKQLLQELENSSGEDN